MTAVFIGFAALFLLAFGYQATWHLADFTRPRFVRFMRRYNRRPNNPVTQHARGFILDRNRFLLAGPHAKGDRRVYPLREVCAHLVGYAHPVYGDAGVERAATMHLSGTGAAVTRDLSELGKRLVDHEAVRGHNVQLTLDARLQDNGYRLLAGRAGAVVCLRPDTGAVLALVSSPSYDPNALTAATFKRDGAPMFNRATRGLYPPGSSFKIVVATAALERGLATDIDCPAEGFSAGPGYGAIRDHEYYAYARRNRRWHGYGRIGIREALPRSSNVYFAKLGVRIGGEVLTECAARFGIGHGTDVFRSGDAALRAKASRLPDIRNGPDGPVAQVAIGQGALLVTPLQMAMITGAIANDGVLMQPHANAAATPRRLGAATSPDVASTVQDLMRRVVTSGTAGAARLWGLPIAGKTGTAQAADGPDHSWFVCYAPADRPAVAMAVLVEHGGYGSSAALPVAVDLLKQCRELGLLEPEDR